MPVCEITQGLHTLARDYTHFYYAIIILQESSGSVNPVFYVDF